MPRGAGAITIEGQFASDVLGTFRIIRGFATLQDLAMISAPYELAIGEDAAAQVQGYQRSINPEHATDIKRYLERGQYRFLPEIIISVRADYRDEVDDQHRRLGVISDAADGLRIKRRWTGKNARTHEIKIRRNRIEELVHNQRRIRRIDGNHRLHLAADLAQDERAPTKYLAPFCAVLLGPPGDVNDDFVESMLFHTINNTALPLDSEHALTLILGQAAGLGPTADEEFATSAALHLTRLLKARLDGLAAPQRERLGATPATVLNAAARAMVARDPSLKDSRAALEQFADKLYAALIDVLARMPGTTPELCKAEFFIELASLAWRDSGDGEHDDRIAKTTATLEAIGRWLGRDGLHRLDGKQSLAGQLFTLYRSIRNRIPKRVFLARWYPDPTDGDELRKADLRKEGIDRAVTDLRAEGIDLAVDDPGTQAGATFPIHQTMYDALKRNDIILVDLSGVRPNVCVEAGYALDHHDRRRIVFMFQPTVQTQNNPKYDRPPFDLGGTFRYEKVRDAAEIPAKLKPHLRAIVQNAALPD